VEKNREKITAITKEYLIETNCY